MSKTVLFFPGQASQYVGMGRDIYEQSGDVKALYEFGSECVGEDIAKLSFEGPLETLTQTRFTQPAILLHSLAVLTLLKDSALEFDYAAGHSLGEYGALAVTGVLSFEDAIRGVANRAALMEEACRNNPGTMAATIGLTMDQIKDVCAAVSSVGIVVPANINSASQIVISGEKAAVEAAVTAAKEAGARRAVLLEVGGAFHSPLMASAKEGLDSFLGQLTFNNPVKPVVTNVTATSQTDSEKFHPLLVEQITSPVLWADTMSFLKENEVTRITEIGPGKVLTSLAKREMKADEMMTIGTMEEIENFMKVAI